MRVWSRVRSRLGAVLRRSRMESEMDAELRFHVEAFKEDLMRDGVAEQEALRRARLEFGAIEGAKEECRETRGVSWVDEVAGDLRFAVRTLRKSRGFTTVAVLTLALGIGANTAIFSYVNAWLIKPLRYPDADRLMVLLSHETKKGWTSKDVTSSADFFDYQQQNTSFAQIAGWTVWYFNLTSDGPPDRVAGGLVSWNFFQTLEAQPILGRAFLPQEAQAGAGHVAIVSRGFWESRFGGDPHIIGRKIKLQGEAYTVVGIMPSDFQFPLMGTTNIWAPLALDDKQRADRNGSWFQAFGRLKPGVTREQASAEMATIGARLEKLYPKTNTNLTCLLSPMTYEIGKNEGAEQILICFWVVGLVLLIACANVANLLLARAAGRARELAVRSALGASRGRLIRQLLTESLLLFVLGGAAGMLFGLYGLRWVENGVPERIRGFLVNYGRVDFDATTFAYTLGIALFCGTIFGLAPAFENSGLDLARALKEVGRQISGTRRAARIRHILVAGEIALAVVVLISTTLLVESLIHMVYGDAGFHSQNVMVAQLVTPPNKYSSESQIRNFYDQVLSKIGAIPEVVAAGASEYIPFGDSNQVEHIHVVGRAAERLGDEAGVQYTAITPNYFSTMKIPLLRGRGIELGDGPGAPNVALISEALSRWQFPNEDPLGKQIEIPLRHRMWTIVGVVHDVKQFTLSDQPEPQLYVSAAQFPSGYMSIVARTSRPATELAQEIRNVIWSVDSEQPVSNVRALDDFISEQNTLMRVTTQMITFFGILALLLSGIGIYGVMAYSVAQRIPEIGIRMALGATPSDMKRQVLGQGLRLTLAGLALGVVTAAGVTRALSSMLYMVKASDAVTFGFVAVVLGLVALAACYVPARRGASVDPIVALRYE